MIECFGVWSDGSWGIDEVAAGVARTPMFEASRTKRWQVRRGICVSVFRFRFLTRFRNREDGSVLMVGGWWEDGRRLAEGLADDRSAAASMCTCTSTACLDFVCLDIVCLGIELPGESVLLSWNKVVQIFTWNCFLAFENFEQIQVLKQGFKKNWG